ncbi:MAG TPA: DUF748 domain-containing protein [Methylomirabilota bacterium]
MAGSPPDPPRSWARRLRSTVTRGPFLLAVAGVVVLVVAYALVGFFLVPRLIRTHGPRFAEQQLQRRAEIGEVRWNPFLFKLEIKHFRLQERDGRPLLAFDRLFVDFEVTSLFRRAWTFAEIQLDAPRVDAVLGADGRLNVADLLESFPKRKGPPTSDPPRMLVQHTVVRDGIVTFTDHSRRASQTVTMEPINVELHDVTTVRERRGPYTITARVAGAALGWEGEVSLVPVASRGRFDVRGFPLATAWRFVQEQIALAEPGGRVDASVRYRFGYQDGATSLNVENLEASMTGVVLAHRDDKAALATLERIRVTGASGDLISRELTVPEISVSGGRVAATMAPDGTVNWQTIVIPPPPSTAPAPTAAPPPLVGAAAPGAGPPSAVVPASRESRPWRVAVGSVRVADVALSVVDRSRVKPVAVDVAGLKLGFSARLEAGGPELAGMVEGIGLTLERVAMREAAAPAPVATLDQIAVSGGRVDLGARHVALERLVATGGAATVVRDADGSVPLVTMLEPGEKQKHARDQSTRPQASPPPAARPWTVALAHGELANHRAAFSDRTVTPPVQIDVGEMKASVRDLRLDGKKPWPFETSFRIAQGGRFAAKGNVAPDGRAIDATVTLTQFAIAPAQPYVAQHAAVVLRSGDVSTTGRFTYRAGGDRPAITFTGSTDVDRLLVVEATSADPVVSWKSLHAETVRFGLTPDRLEIDEVRVAELDGEVIIYRDKTINVARLMKPPEAPSASPAPSALPRAAPAERETRPIFPVTIGRVRLDAGSMHFADLSLVLPFETRMHSLNGVVAGLGSDTNSRATVKLDGQVDEFGSVKVEGALSAFQPKEFADIAVTFRNVAMSTLSPYSATFAGRRIATGTMDIDLQYKLDHGALVGENRVVLRELRLGERVESPGAMRLPLDLAIAILSDSDGRIDLELPVRGSVDHPEFSYGHLIWQALTTVITKVVTSPFKALGALFGGDSQTVEAITFEAGSAVVPPPERQKLKRVADVLAKRPRLTLTVHGTYEAKMDSEALRSFQVRQDLAERLGVKVKPGEDPGPVAFDDAKTQRALEALLTERAGDKAVAEMLQEHEKSTGKKPERANRLRGVVGRASGDRALYEAMFKRLVETAPLAEAELTDLAKRRGEAAVRALQDGAAAAGERAHVGETEIAKSAERSGVPTRLELGAAGS